MKQQLKLNITRRYKHTHRHLDDWIPIGEIEFFKSEEYGPDWDNEEAVLFQDCMAIVELGDSHTLAEAEQALQDMVRRDCNCEHDCCGCFFGGITSNIKWVCGEGHIARFTTRYQRNF